MKALECSQDFSHYKYMGIFQNAQGQLTLQSMVASGQISILWLSSLPAKMKKIRPTSSTKGNDAHVRVIIQSEKNGNINFSDA